MIDASVRLPSMFASNIKVRPWNGSTQLEVIGENNCIIATLTINNDSIEELVNELYLRCSQSFGNRVHLCMNTDALYFTIALDADKAAHIARKLDLHRIAEVDREFWAERMPTA